MVGARSEETLARVRLAGQGGFRSDRLLALVEAAGSAAEVLRSKPRALAETGVVTVPEAERLLAVAARFDAEGAIERAEQLGAELLFWDDPKVPDLLRSITDPPVLLYCLGAMPARLEGAAAPLPVAVVGSRRPTPYGERMARRLAREAAEAGLVVVSGMARGIDHQAHRAALEAGGTTWAVLGSGLGKIYPAELAPLARAIAERGGAVLSELPPDAPPLAENFPRRNRIVSGLSWATIVVEGDARSGSLITARLAVEQGREVFAVPGPADSAMSAGPHRLIKEGATLTAGLADVLEVLTHLKPARPPQADARRVPAKDGSPEGRLLAGLARGPVTIDELSIQTGSPASEVSRLLLDLELQGEVVSLGAQRWGMR